jgi:hypothetical protein
MSWLAPRPLRDPGVPYVGRTHWSCVDDPGPETAAWFVEYPDSFEWSCCRETNYRIFTTWPEALAFADSVLTDTEGTNHD